MPEQYSRLIGHTLKYPYLVGISTDSGNCGTGIVISPRFVLTCGHVLQDSTCIEVISQEGRTFAEAKKLDDTLDLALLELERPISAPKVTFTNSPLQSGAVFLTAGVQATPGQPDALSVAEIKLKYGNENNANGSILDIQLEGSARPGYSGGPVVVKKGGALLCIGVMRRGGYGVNSNAIGLAPIQAFVAEYVHIPVGESMAPKRIHRVLTLTALLLGTVVVGAITEWYYVASHSPKVTSDVVVVNTQEPDKPASGQPARGKKRSQSLPQDPGDHRNLQTRDSAPIKNTTSTAPNNVSSVQAQKESSVPGYMPPSQPLTDPNKVDQGNPEVKVWVNTSSKSKKYHCPGTRWHGTTAHGEYMTQAEAQKKGYGPAYNKLCE